MLRFSSTTDAHFVEVELLESGALPQNHGDVFLSVEAHSHGFHGSSDVWVLAAELQAFLVALRRLNETLRGSAVLRSASPGELELEVLAVSSRGNLAVRGELGRQVQGRERAYWHATTFGFEFEPTQLEVALATPWLPISAA